MMQPQKISKKLSAHLATAGLVDAKVKVIKRRLWYHVHVISDSFIGMSDLQRDNLIWRAFEAVLDDQTILMITQCYLMTKQEAEQAELSPIG